MRDISAALNSFLQSKSPFWMADLFTFTLATGATLYLTSADQPVTYGTTTWEPASTNACSLTRGTWSVKNTPDVPTLEIHLLSTGSDYAGGANIKLALHNGLLDGCWVDLNRAFMPMASGAFGDTSLGIVNLFSGWVGQVEITGTGAKLTVKGANYKLQEYMPRNRFMINCIHALYDTNCGVARAAHTYTATIASASSLTLNWQSDPTGGNFANLVAGAVLMTSGAASGSKRTVGSASAGGVAMSYPLYQVPAAGDTFTITFGCDKTASTCAARFGNAANFRGFPWIPPAETAVVA